MKYALYAVVPAGYLVMFALSRGFFLASAKKILAGRPKLAEQVRPEVLARALMIFLAADFAAAASVKLDELSDTVSRGYLMRGEAGEGSRTEELRVAAGGEETEVVLELPERKPGDEEIREVLDAAAAALPALVFGKKQKNAAGFYETTENLQLPGKAGEQVSVLWMTDRPDILDWDGLVGKRIPPEGVSVRLTAILSYMDSTEETVLPVFVKPPVLSGAEALRREAEEAVEDTNDASELKVTLPGKVGGKTALWAPPESGSGESLLMLGMLAAVLYVYAMIRRREQEKQLRLENLLQNYPGIVNKLVLYTTAGMSIRKAMERIALDYRRQREQYGKEQPGYEEIVKTCRDMANGMPETEAYRALGKRAQVREYRSLAAVISQNLKKGGSEMTAILERMAIEAQEDRKKRAKIRGDEAGTKLLLPMLLMLVLVMALLMVPAFITFF